MWPESPNVSCHMTVWHIEAQAAAVSCIQRLHPVPQVGQMNSESAGMASLSHTETIF